MALHPNYHPGARFEHTAARENDISELLNDFGITGIRAGKPGSRHAITVPVVSPSKDLPAGTAVEFTGFADAAGTVCTCAPSADQDVLWGVIPAAIEKDQIGSAVVSGIVRIPIPEDSHGKHAAPTTSGALALNNSMTGAPVIARDETSALILLGGGAGARPYDGPFALAYEPETDLVFACQGFLSRNGEFLEVIPQSFLPRTGYVCVISELQEGGTWTEPVIDVAEPGPYSYPIGYCSAQENAVTVKAFGVPVAVIVVTDICPLSTYE